MFLQPTRSECTWRDRRLPSPTQINLSVRPPVHPSIRPSICTCLQIRYSAKKGTGLTDLDDIQRKMAQCKKDDISQITFLQPRRSECFTSFIFPCLPIKSYHNIMARKRIMLLKWLLCVGIAETAHDVWSTLVIDWAATRGAFAVSSIVSTHLLIAQSLLMDLSKISCPESCFF